MRLGGLFFHVPAPHEAAEVAFWAELFGARRRGGDYLHDRCTLQGGHGAPFPVEVQRMGSEKARVHTDVESPHVDADADRLEALGATRVAKIEGWWGMRDPASPTSSVVLDC